MKITILGSGHGVPEAHKQCTSILFEISGGYYFIDDGGDISTELANRRIHPNEVKGIFITHPIPIISTDCIRSSACSDGSTRKRIQRYMCE